MFYFLKPILNLLFNITSDERGLIKDGQTVYPDDGEKGEEEEGKEEKEGKEKEKDPNAEGEESPEKDKEESAGAKDKSKGEEEASPEKDKEEEPEADGKYGEFGDDPDKLWEAYQNRAGKMGATEGNLSNLRTALDKSGIGISTDEDGNITFTEKEPSKEKETKSFEKKFTDEHKKKLSSFFDKEEDGNTFVELLSILAQDAVDQGFFNTKQVTLKNKAAVTKFLADQETANGILDEMYPELDPGNREDFSKGKKAANKVFNQAFYDRATEIWQQKYQGKDAYGELKSAREAAAELQIVLKRSGSAKKEGYQQGKAGKKIVGPVDGSSDKSEKEGGKLTKQEYLALSEEEREEHDKKNI